MSLCKLILKTARGTGWGRGKGWEGVAQAWPVERGTPVLAGGGYPSLGWGREGGSPFLTRVSFLPPPFAWKGSGTRDWDIPSRHQKEPGTRDWVTLLLPLPLIRTWDQRPGTSKQGYPSPSNWWTDKQTENITSVDEDGNYIYYFLNVYLQFRLLF